MPDPTGRTVSASQAPALFGKSPYATRWMLHHRFAGAIPEQAPSGRMDWGKALQPLLLRAAAADLKLEVAAPEAEGLAPTDLYDGQPYVRRDNLGCTKDAIVNCPERGAGALEAKCCFDYRQWMTRWAGGAAPPEDTEIQLQCQLHVGDGREPYAWGVVAVWVCGDMHYFERKYLAEIGAR